MRIVLSLTLALLLPMALAGCLAGAAVTPLGADAAAPVPVEDASFRLLADGAPRLVTLDVPAGTTARLEVTEPDVGFDDASGTGCLAALYLRGDAPFDGARFLRPLPPFHFFTTSSRVNSVTAGGDGGIIIAWQCAEDTPLRVHVGDGSTERELAGAVDERVRHEGVPLEGGYDAAEPVARVVQLSADREVTKVPAQALLLSGVKHRESASAGATLVHDFGVHAPGEAPAPVPFPSPEARVSPGGWSMTASSTWPVNLDAGAHVWYERVTTTAGPEDATYAFQVAVLPVIE